jgi:hypothetical protein
MKIMVARYLALALIVNHLTSCAAPQLTRPQGPATLRPAAEIEAATIAWNPDCPLPTVDADGHPMLGGSGLESFLPTSIAGTAANFAINAIGAWLKQRQAQRNAVWAATGVLADCTDGPNKNWQNETMGRLRLARAVIDANGSLIGTPGFELEGKLNLKRAARASCV